MATDEATRTLRYVPFEEIRIWLYARDPREAMLLTCDPKFQRFLQAKRNEKKIARAVNWVRRNVWGL